MTCKRGGVGGALSGGRPYPDIDTIFLILNSNTYSNKVFLSLLP